MLSSLVLVLSTFTCEDVKYGYNVMNNCCKNDDALSLKTNVTSYVRQRETFVFTDAQYMGPFMANLKANCPGNITDFTISRINSTACTCETTFSTHADFNHNFASDPPYYFLSAINSNQFSSVHFEWAFPTGIVFFGTEVTSASTAQLAAATAQAFLQEYFPVMTTSAVHTEMSTVSFPLVRRV